MYRTTIIITYQDVTRISYCRYLLVQSKINQWSLKVKHRSEIKYNVLN